jgi:hypothetical protein
MRCGSHRTKILARQAPGRYRPGGGPHSYEGLFDAEVNVYHKTLENLASYREGYVNLMGDGNWKAKVETGGMGEAWGAEFFLRKNLGKWNGFASYTWSKATRQFENINNGAEFLYDYDRPTILQSASIASSVTGCR